MADSNKYKIIVSAEINTAEIQKQLSQFGKTAKIKVDSNGVKQAAKDVGFLGVKWADATKKFLAWKIIGDAFSGIERAATQMVTSVYELDKALTEFNKVTDLSATQLDKFIDKAYKAGEATARTGTEMLRASTEFAKAGFDENQSLELAKTATMFQNIADTEISAAEASSFIISQIKAFNIEAENSARIINVVNEVANKFAVGSDDLQSALTKAGSSMGVLGNSYEETVGIITAGTEIMVGQSSKVSRGIRTIGINLAKMATETGVLETASGKASISLKDENQEMKSTFDIMSDLYPIWKTLNDEQKTTLAQNVAGKNQFEVFVNTLNNFGTAIDATAVAMNSEGSAIRENEVYMQSMEAKLNTLKSAFEDFSRKTLDSDFLKSIIDAGTALIKFADSDIGRTIISVLALALAIKGVSVATRTILAMQGVKSFFIGLSLVFSGLTSGATGASIAISALTKTMMASPLFIGVAVIAGISAIVTVVDKLNVSFEEQSKIVEDLTSEISSLQSEYDALMSKTDITDSERIKLQLLQSQLAVKKELLLIETQGKYDKFKKEDQGFEMKNVLGWNMIAPKTPNAQALEASNQKIQEQTDEILDLDTNSKNYSKTLEKLTAQREKEIKTQVTLKDKLIEENLILQSKIDLGGKLSSEEQKTFDDNMRLIQATDVLMGSTSALEKTFMGVKEALEVSTGALNEFSTSGEISAQTLQSIKEKFSEVDGIDAYISKLSSTEITADEVNSVLAEMSNALVSQRLATLNSADAINKFIGNLGAEAVASGKTKSELAALAAQQIITSNTGLSFTQQIAALGALAASAFGAKSALAGVFSGGGSDVSRMAMEYMRQHPGMSASQAQSIVMQGLWKQPSVPSAVPNAVAPPAGGGSGGGGKKSDPIEEQSKIFKEQVNILEHKLFLQSQIENSEKKQIEIQKELQKKVSEQANWFRSQGVDENSKYIQELQKQWWNYQKEITEIQKQEEEKRQKALVKYLEREKEKLEATLSIYGKYAEGRADIAQKEIDRLNAEKNSLQKLNDEREDAIRLQELENELAKAKNKQVRIYREGKGFVYEQDLIAVSDAQKNLEEYKRQESLKKEQDRIDTEIKLWDEEKKKWSEVVSNYKEQQDLLLAEQISGISLEKLNQDTRLANLKNFIFEYNKLNAELKLIDETIAPPSSSDGKLGFDPNVDYQALINSATSQAEKDYYNQQRNEKIDAGYGGGYDKNKWANGTANYQGGALVVGKNVGEHGREIITPPKGSGIIPNPLTERLMDFGRNPLEFLSGIIRRPSFDKNYSGQSVVENYNISGVNVNANNANEFLSSIKALAIQRTTNRK